jgi:hypothetical protein
MTRSFLRTVARGLVGVLFLAQMAIAAYACPALASGASGTMQMPAQNASPDEGGQADVGMSMAPSTNCDDMVGAMDPSSPNLCAEHCKQGQQSDKAPTLNAPAAVLTALYATPLVPEPALPPRSAAASLSALVAASPPHTILHCVYRL